MDVKKYNIKDLTLAYFNKKSQIYRSGGYKQARVLTRDKEDYINHFFAFLIDINICLLPVYIWVIEFLLILCGLISPHFFGVSRLRITEAAISFAPITIAYRYLPKCLGLYRISPLCQRSFCLSNQLIRVETSNPFNRKMPRMAIKAFHPLPDAEDAMC